MKEKGQKRKSKTKSVSSSLSSPEMPKKYPVKKAAKVSKKTIMCALLPKDYRTAEYEEACERQIKMNELLTIRMDCLKAKEKLVSAGYVFSPTEEKIFEYLKNRTFRVPMEFCPIMEVNVYAKHPQSLIEIPKDTPEQAWYFFTRGRPNQTGTGIRGRWHFGKKEDVFNQGLKVGVKQVLEYSERRHTSEYKIMEYQLDPVPDGSKTGSWFICKLYKDGAV